VDNAQDIEFDFTQFNVTSEILNDEQPFWSVNRKGHGTVRVTQTLPASPCTPGATVVLVREYTLASPESRYLVCTFKVTTSVKIENVRIWMGTKDDWIGSTDGPSKAIGDFDEDGNFQVLDTDSNCGDGRGRTLKVFSGAEGLYFTTPKWNDAAKVGGKAVHSSCCSFYNTYRLSPTCAPATRKGDGSYGIFLPIGDVDVNQTKVQVAPARVRVHGKGALFGNGAPW
jgi:hypothetical protein